MAEAKALAEEQARRAQEAALWAATQVRQQQSRFPPNIPTKGRPPPPQPPPPHLTPTYPPTPSPVTSNPPSVGGLGDLRGIPGGVDLLGSSPPGYPAVGPGGDSQDKQNNPLLVNLLDNERAHTSPAGGTAQQQQQQQAGMPVTESPMLSRLLEDNISVATNINPISVIPTGLQQPAQPKPKGTKGRKRRSQSDLPAGRSPKHRISDSDPNERYSSLDLDSSSSPFESSLGEFCLTNQVISLLGAKVRPESERACSMVLTCLSHTAYLHQPKKTRKKTRYNFELLIYLARVYSLILKGSFSPCQFCKMFHWPFKKASF